MALRANLAEALLGGAERASRAAIREPGRGWSYAELSRHMARVGGALRALGVEKGDRVAVLMPDGLEFAAALLGAVRVGAIAVPISELLKPLDIRSLVGDCGATVAIVHASLEPFFDEVRREMPTLREVVVVAGAHGGERSFEALLAGAEPAPFADTEPDDPALILYSAGASEAPKGVLHTHRTVLAAYQAYGQAVLALGEQDRVFSAIKLATAFGLGAGLVFPLAAGGEAVLLPQQPRSTAIFDVLRDQKPTVMFATPSLYGQLLGDVVPGGPSALASLRLCVAGGESMPAALGARLSRQLGVEVITSYGLTEAFTSVISNRPGASRAGSCGQVVPGYEARVVGEDGAALKPSEIGRLVIKGPSVSPGYWGRPEDSAAVFGPEWMRTGDRFLVDEDGYHYHCGRADGLFKVGGKWVSPIEVERTLLAHAAVWECAVVGVEDEDGLTKPFAFVVPNVGHTPGPELERQLIEFVKREIAPYKYPRWIDFVDSLPKGSGGKVLRYKLRPKPHKRRVQTSG